MKNQEQERKTLPKKNLIAPLGLLAFALVWYQFSVVYIQGANLQLVEHNNLSVYVPLQQLGAYMTAVLGFTYATVSIALILFSYNLVRFIQLRLAQGNKEDSNAYQPMGE